MLSQDNITGGLRQSLVTTPISQQDHLQVHPVSIRIKRYNTGKTPEQTPDRTGSTIQSFSSKSRSRLRFMAINAYPKLISQLGLTYHQDWPTSGRECKRHLNAFLVALRRILPNTNYLWMMEFQKRNAPHFHIFLTTAPDPNLHHLLAVAWVGVSKSEHPAALAFHRDPRNWIDWDMGSANYLCKYLDKTAQKYVPEGYTNFGRFWGNSRQLLSDPVVVPLEDLNVWDKVDESTGEVMSGQAVTIRWLGRLADKQTNNYSRFRQRAPHGSYTMLRGAKAYQQIERYLGGQK